jgi:outer membrane lipoprotein
MTTVLRSIAIVTLLLALSACATAPFDLAGADMELTPSDVLKDSDNLRGRRVVWGGKIVNTRNLNNATEIEVLGYPLTSAARVDFEEPALRRFLLVENGYLESTDYRRGRYVSAVGTLDGLRNGKVDEAPYVYPVLRAERLHLWPVDELAQRPRFGFNFGIGVIIH